MVGGIILSGALGFLIAYLIYTVVELISDSEYEFGTIGIIMILLVVGLILVAAGI